MRSATAVVALAILATSPATAACQKDSVKAILDNGGTIILASGKSYSAAGTSGAYAALDWHSGDRVLVCDGVMIDRSRKNEDIDVTPHRP
jgi:hypothetical protein